VKPTQRHPASTRKSSTPRSAEGLRLLVIPGGGHGSGGSPYGWRRTMDFFVRKLLRVEPRATE
jgi:hypothetical protein